MSEEVNGSMTAEVTEEDLITLTVKWTEDKLLTDKHKEYLQLILQPILNKRKIGEECTVKNVTKDGKVVLSIKPASAISGFLDVTGQTLMWKDAKYKIISVDQIPPELQPQDENGGEADPSLLSAGECDEATSLEHSGASIAEGGEICDVSLSEEQFWYVNKNYREEIRRIEEENGVQIKPEVKVSFIANQGGNCTKACNDFTTLVQRSLGEFMGDSFPLTSAKLNNLVDTLNMLQANKEKFLLTVSPEGVAIYGPQSSQHIISKYLNQPQNELMQSSLHGESSWVSQRRTQIGMNIEDPLVPDGLSMDERLWEKINVSSETELANIKEKYGVVFKELGITQGNLIIKVKHTSGLEAASMESHAMRALLRLYWKILVSPGVLANLDPTQTKDGTENQEESNSEDNVEAGASGSSRNGDSQTYMDNAERLTGGGATAGGSAGKRMEEMCPICLDIIINKAQLKCKHEFCQHCLTQTIETMGPICPICRQVFAKMQGDQPDGHMDYIKNSVPLPGFPDCGTIVINYNIQGGIQTKRHPNPGQRYSGTCRQAFLPDNKEGNNVLQLLRKAFEQKMIFTVGMSRTTGTENQVTWNDIHHKTNRDGGPNCYGYPDPNYLKRVKEELKAKGIE